MNEQELNTTHDQPRFKASRLLVFESIVDAVVGLDCHQSVIDWNREAETLFGWAQGEVLGQKLSDLVPIVTKINGDGTVFEFLKASGVSQRFEGEAQRRDGGQFKVEVTFFPMERREPKFFYLFIRDISKREQAEEAIVASEQRYHDLIDGLDLGLIWSTDASGKNFNFVSPQATAVSGFPPEVWLKEPNFFINHIFYDDREKVAKAFESLSKTNTGFELDHRFQKANDNVIWLHTDVRAVKRGTMQHTALKGVSVDVTNVKEPERLLDAHYEAMQTLSRSGVVPDTMSEVLRIMGQKLGWECASIWFLNHRETALECSATWLCKNFDWPIDIVPTLMKGCSSNEGSLGKVWQTETLNWTKNLASDYPALRGTLNRKKLPARFSIPLHMGDHFLGVIEFVTCEVRPPNDSLLQTMAILGEQIGHFIARSKIEASILNRPPISSSKRNKRGRRESGEVELIRLTMKAQRERRKFESLFTGSPTCMALLRGADLTFEKTNSAFQSLIGNRQVIGIAFAKALSEFRSQPLFTLMNQVFATGKTFTGKEIFVEFPFLRSPKVRYLDVTCMRVEGSPESHGVPYGLQISVIDVTNKVEARRTITASEQRLRQLSNAIPLMVWTANAQGQVDYVNDGWTRYTGLTVEDSCGDNWALIVHRFDVEGAKESWKNAVALGKSFEHQYRIIQASDNQARWHLVRAVPVLGTKGEVLRWFGTATDIDDQKRALDAQKFLDEASGILGSTLNYKETLQSLAELVVSENSDFCNIAMVGEDDEGLTTVAVAHKDSKKVNVMKALLQKNPIKIAFRHFGNEVMRLGKPQIYETVTDEMLKGVARDKEYFRLMRSLGMRSVILVPLVGKASPFGLLTLITSEERRRYNQSDLKLAQELARRASLAIENARLYFEMGQALRTRDEFISIASHELKTPLTSLQLQIEIARRQIRKRNGDHLTSENMLNILDLNDRQVVKLGRLVEDMLDVSRISLGRLELKRETYDLAEHMREALGRLLPQLSLSGSKFAIRASGPLIGHWDPFRVDQVIVNLLTNASKYGRGKPIEISLRAENGDAVFSIRDHGLGIAREAQDRVFERFERAISASVIGGLGLGLYISRSIVNAHGGTIEVESEIGNGAEFTVRLPRRLDFERV
jgi:PAS domain S-box-containing protein